MMRADADRITRRQWNAYRRIQKEGKFDMMTTLRGSDRIISYKVKELIGLLKGISTDVQYAMQCLRRGEGVNACGIFQGTGPTVDRLCGEIAASMGGLTCSRTRFGSIGMSGWRSPWRQANDRGYSRRRTTLPPDLPDSITHRRLRCYGMCGQCAWTVAIGG